MVDWLSIQKQLQQMVQEQTLARDEGRERLERAVEEWHRFAPQWEALREKARASRTSWLLADFRESWEPRFPPEESPLPYVALAADGSQIFPDRHGFVACYLINIGAVAIPYGLPERPRLSSQPTLFYREEDLYPEWGGKRALITPDILATRRMLMELETLADWAEEWAQRSVPIVALADGSLISWPLESKPPDYQAFVLERLRALFDRFRALRVPVAGYISRPGGAEVINVLRVGICPEVQVNCDRCPYKRPPVQEEGSLLVLPLLPCEVIAGVSDGSLFEAILELGERSPSFESQSQILDLYGPHRIVAFYLHAGQEIARVEMPAWVANDPPLLERLHSALVDQVRKGHGYPLVLTEAHEQAVLRSADRDFFYLLLERLFAQSTLPLRTSSKSRSKRIPRI